MKAIGYMRCSTAKQGRSGLGLEAQRKSIRDFCEKEGIELLDEFTEVASGKNDDRPVLKEALRTAKKQNCYIVVSKLDRLSRDVHFITGLMSHTVPFIVTELGKDVDSFTLHIFAALSQKERELISQRTKQGLSAAKVRGVVLGNKKNLPEAQKLGVETNKAIADDFATSIWEVIKPMYQEKMPLRQIAIRLEELGVSTARGGVWTAAQVSNIVKRMKDK